MSKKKDRRTPEQIEKDTLNGHEWGECPDCGKEDVIHSDFICCSECFKSQHE